MDQCKRRPTAVERGNAFCGRHLILAVFGFAFVRAWDVVFGLQFAALFDGPLWLSEDVIHVGKLPVFLAFALAGRRFVPLYRHPWSIAAASIAMAVAAGLLLLIPLVPHALLPVAACVLLAGSGSAFSILIWAELQSCFNALKIVLYIAGGFFLGSVLGWLALGLEGSRLVVVLLVLPALSYGCINVGFAKVPNGSLPATALPRRLKFPWRMALVLGVYEFAFGYRQASQGFSGETYALGVTVAAGALFVLAYTKRFERFDFAQLWRLPFVLVVCGLIMVFFPFASEGVAANVLVSAGYAMIFLLLTILLCDLSHRYGASAAILCSIEQLVMYAKIGGHAAIAYGESGSAGAHDVEMVVSAALVIAVVLVSMLAVSQKELSKWGLSFFGMSEFDELEAVAQRRDARAEELTASCGLSPREAEVLLLLTTDATAAEIEQALCIASGTLKSHTRRIYQKLDIHSRGELRALFE